MEKILFKKIELWIVLLLMIFGVVGTIVFGWSVRLQTMTNGDNSRLGAFGPVVEKIAALPTTIRDIFVGKGGKKDLSVSDREAGEQRFEGQAGFQFNYPPDSRPDLGYILVNRYDGDKKYSVSELWDLNRQTQIHRWDFSSVDAIWLDSKLKSVHVNPAVDHAAKRFRSAHAFLTTSGDIYTHSFGAPILKSDACSALSIFQDEAFYHHSIEMDHNGNFWVPKRIEPKSVDIGSLNFSDDAISLISPEGKILFEKSIIQLLDDNGLGYLIYGKGVVSDDPIHLNDIQPVLSSGPFWKKGDVFLSLRHQSMIVLYRPSTNKVIWHKQGPWIHQHDVNVISDHQISIFNNNSVTSNKSVGYGIVRGSNNVLVFDFRSGEVSSPFQRGFGALDIRTKSEGRGEIIGKEIFVEETNYGRLVQFDQDGVVSWQFINRANDGHIYLVNWSRTISRELGDRVLANVIKRGCP